MTHDELIAALEAASGPSGLLDMHIANAIDGPHRHYTSSIDAALTLVPEGWGPSLIAWAVEALTERNERVRASMTRHNNIPDDATDFSSFYSGADAATPALALCIAALRARAG